MHGPTTAPAAPPPSPAGWELSGADGGEYGGEGCQMLASMLPHPTPEGALQLSLPCGPQGPWRGCKAECQSGCLDL